MELHLPYGDDKRAVRLPLDVNAEYLTPAAMPPLEDAAGDLEDHCRNPIGDVSPLDVPEGGTVAILVADVTRSKGIETLLPALVALLREGGVAADAIRIVVARGTHRSLTREEREFFRQGNLNDIKVEEHDCDASEKLSALLLTRRGTPVRVNTSVRTADRKILLSPISFHYFAGFGGGRKLVLPGCADRGAIMANHRLSLTDTRPVKLNPGCKSGRLDGNPVHEDMLEALEALTGVSGINFFTDSDGKVVFVNAGDPVAAHRRACDVYRDAHLREVQSPFRTMILSSGGHPYDINFLQSHKALRHASEGLEEGGTILFYAQCAEGIGSESLERALTMDRKKFLNSAYADYGLNNQTAVSLLDLTERFEIGMVSAMNVDVLLSCGIKPCVNPESFLVEALEKHQVDRIAVVKNGNSLLPWHVRGDD